MRTPVVHGSWPRRRAFSRTGPIVPGPSPSRTCLGPRAAGTLNLAGRDGGRRYAKPRTAQKKSRPLRREEERLCCSTFGAGTASATPLGATASLPKRLPACVPASSAGLRPTDPPLFPPDSRPFWAVRAAATAARVSDPSVLPSICTTLGRPRRIGFPRASIRIQSWVFGQIAKSPRAFRNSLNGHWFCVLGSGRRAGHIP